MATFQLQEPSTTGSPTNAAPPIRPQVVNDPLDTLRDEVLSYYAEMREFGAMDVVDVFLSLSAWSARVGELRAYIVMRDDRKANALRTKILDPFLEQVDFQFKVHSRIQAVREMEARLAGGQV